MNPLQAKTEIEERVKILPEDIVELITEGDVELVASTMGNLYSLSSQQVELLENEIVLTLLMFLPVDSFTQRVSESLEIRNDIAERITSQVHAEINYILEDILQLVDEAKQMKADGNNDAEIAKKMAKKEELASLAQTFAQKSVQSTAVPQTPTQTQESPTEKIPAMRTMHDDITRIHGYGSVASTQNNEEPIVTALSQEETFTPTPPQPQVNAQTKEPDPQKIPIANKTSWSLDDSNK